jgi:hypothetical protein
MDTEKLCKDCASSTQAGASLNEGLVRAVWFEVPMESVVL